MTSLQITQRHNAAVSPFVVRISQDHSQRSANNTVCVCSLTVAGVSLDFLNTPLKKNVRSMCCTDVTKHKTNPIKRVSQDRTNPRSTVPITTRLKLLDRHRGSNAAETIQYNTIRTSSDSLAKLVTTNGFTACCSQIGTRSSA